MGGQCTHIWLHMKTHRTSKSPLFASMAAALLLGVMGPANAASLQMRGFRGLMWGDPPAHLGAAHLVSTEAGVQCFERERENLLFGDATLQSVRYCFQDGALFLVRLSAAGSGAALRSEFERGYGAPEPRSTGALLRWGDAWGAASAELSRSASGALLQLRSQPQPQASAR